MDRARRGRDKRGSRRCVSAGKVAGGTLFTLMKSGTSLELRQPGNALAEPCPEFLITQLGRKAWLGENSYLLSTS